MSKPQLLAGSQRYTAIVDIGKTSSRLLLIDDQGRTVNESAQASASMPSGQGYLALDTEGCERWLHAALKDLGPLAQGLRRVIVTTHGAAVAGVSGGSLAFPVPDYEAEAFDDRDAALAGEIDPFAETLSPLLPRGLNMGVQRDWLRSRRPERLLKAGQESGEKVWRMPLGPEYDKLIDSQFADMKNTGGRHGGSITAAQFLQRFVDNTPWAHLDIAGTAMGAPKTDINQSWGSGYGVRLLDRLVADHYEGK